MCASYPASFTTRVIGQRTRYTSLYTHTTHTHTHRHTYDMDQINTSVANKFVKFVKKLSEYSFPEDEKLKDFSVDVEGFTGENVAVLMAPDFCTYVNELRSHDESIITQGKIGCFREMNLENLWPLLDDADPIHVGIKKSFWGYIDDMASLLNLVAGIASTGGGEAFNRVTMNLLGDALASGNLADIANGEDRTAKAIASFANLATMQKLKDAMPSAPDPKVAERALRHAGFGAHMKEMKKSMESNPAMQNGDMSAAFTPEMMAKLTQGITKMGIGKGSASVPNVNDIMKMMPGIMSATAQTPTDESKPKSVSSSVQEVDDDRDDHGDGGDGTILGNVLLQKRSVGSSNDGASVSVVSESTPVDAAPVVSESTSTNVAPVVTEKCAPPVDLLDDDVLTRSVEVALVESKVVTSDSTDVVTDADANVETMANVETTVETTVKTTTGTEENTGVPAIAKV